MDVVKKIKDGSWQYFCPACDGHHMFWTPKWAFNGDTSAPTVTPSLSMSWPTPDPENYAKNVNNVCHLFLKNGRIEYCRDSTHAYAGKTVNMVQIKDWPF